MKRLLTLAPCLALALLLASPSFAQVLTPQGRLTLVNNTPVMTSDVATATTVYYTPYIGNKIPIGGTNYSFSQLTLTLNSTYQTTGNIYDIFAYASGSTVAIGVNVYPWPSSSGRGVDNPETDITQVAGIWVNQYNNEIDLFNGSSPTGAEFGVGALTYLGSIYMTGNGETSFLLKPAAHAGGSAPIIGLWNAYNRVPAYALSRDSNVSWTYSSSTWRPTDNSAWQSNGSASNSITWLDGLAQSPVDASAAVQAATATSNSQIAIGVVEDSTTATPDVWGLMAPVSSASFFLQSPGDNFYPQLGLHYVQAMEAAGGSVTDTFYGSGLVQALNWKGEY